MSFERPTLERLRSRAISDIETRVKGISARLKFSVERAIAFMVAAIAHGLYGHMFYLSKQLLPDTCGPAMLRRWASVLGVPVKQPAKASGSVNFVGTNGSTITAGSTWQRSDGVEFVVDETLTIVAGAASGTVTAVLAGDDGNTVGGSALTAVSPLAGINSNASVDGDGLNGGADAEDVESSLRPRVLSRLRKPPIGGGPGDYERLALEVPGVTRAWEYKGEQGAGSVVLRFACDDPDDIDVSPIPSPGKVAEVAAYIESKGPLAATIYVVAPVALPLNPSIDLTPDATDVRAAVKIELAGYLRRSTKPGQVVPWSQLNESISLAAGETDHSLTVPSANVTPATGELPVLGTINWL